MLQVLHIFFRGVSNAWRMSYCTYHEQIIHYSQVKELDDVDYRCTYFSQLQRLNVNGCQ